MVAPLGTNPLCTNSISRQCPPICDPLLYSVVSSQPIKGILKYFWIWNILKNAKFCKKKNTMFNDHGPPVCEGHDKNL